MTTDNQFRWETFNISTVICGNDTFSMDELNDNLATLKSEYEEIAAAHPNHYDFMIETEIFNDDRVISLLWRVIAKINLTDAEIKANKDLFGDRERREYERLKKKFEQP